MTTAYQNEKPIVKREGATFKRDCQIGAEYRRLSRICDRVLMNGCPLRETGGKLPLRLVRLSDGRQYALLVVARKDKHGQEWIAAHFLSCADPAHSRRLILKGRRGTMYLLLEEEQKAVANFNKYAIELGMVLAQTGEPK